LDGVAQVKIRLIVFHNATDAAVYVGKKLGM
jgi:hypothetical protein